MGSLANQIAPWLLAVLDAAAHALIYCALVRGSLLDRLVTHSHYRYSVRSSTEDVLLLALVRAAVISVASCSGVDRFKRPYLFASIGCSLIGVPFFITKAAVFRYNGPWYWASTMLVLSLVFSLAHVLCSMSVVDLARRRYSQGTVMGFNVRSWEHGEEAWLNANAGGHPSPLADSESSWLKAWKGDVLPEALADCDSRFMKINDVAVHYKVADPGPPDCTAGPSPTGIVLVHGFGAGVFCWRHIMAPLAQATGCRVVAFDRPAFGLTSRPSKISRRWNPFTSPFQVDLLLQLCAALKLEEVVLVGHADGALVALMSASVSAKSSRAEPAGPSCSAASDGDGLRQAAQHLGGPEDTSLEAAAGASAACHHSSGAPTSAMRPTSGGAAQQNPARSTATLRPSRSSEVTAALLAPGDDPELGAAGVLGPQLGAGAGAGASAGAALSQGEGKGHHARGRQMDPAAEEDAVLDGCAPGGLAARLQEASSHGVRVCGMAMLHPSLEGELKPQFMRLLSRSRVGRRIMRPLLRTEIGEVANRRSWFDQEKLTKDVLDLYKRPLCVQGWDTALMRLSRGPKAEASAGDLLHLFTDVAEMPSVIIGGDHDRAIPRRRLEAIHEQLPRSSICFLPSCGHLSHEESPAELLMLLEALVGEALLPRGS